MAQGNKSRIVIWTIVGILVVAAVIFLIIARKGATVAVPFTAEDAAKYVERTTRRLDKLTQDATELRAQFGTDPEFARFDSLMELARAGLQEMQGTTDEKALGDKRKEIEGHRVALKEIINGFKKK